MNKKPLNILYVGALWDGSTALQRMQALEELGHKIQPVDTLSEHAKNQESRLYRRILRKFFGPPDLTGANANVIRAVSKESFDVVWIDKGLTVCPGTFETIKACCPECRIVGYSPDDMVNKGNQSRNFIRSLPLYDMYFTTKSYGVSELKRLGCRDVRFIGNAYDPHIHRPVKVCDGDRINLGGPVGFIGQWEQERAKSLCFLAEKGIDVRVWGYTWGRPKHRLARLCLENRPLWSRDYARAICVFDINLCFLRKANRDLQTTRSIEIPACGGFMLAERTDEHLALFEEGKEAEFFENDEELLDKVRYYLSHPQQRKKIAAAGQERCLRSGYSNLSRMREMLSMVAEL